MTDISVHKGSYHNTFDYITKGIQTFNYHYPKFECELVVVVIEQAADLFIDKWAVAVDGPFQGNKILPGEYESERMLHNDVFSWLHHNKIDVVYDGTGTYYRKWLTEDEMFLIMMTFPMKYIKKIVMYRPPLSSKTS